MGSAEQGRAAATCRWCRRPLSARCFWKAPPRWAWSSWWGANQQRHRWWWRRGRSSCQRASTPPPRSSWCVPTPSGTAAVDLSWLGRTSHSRYRWCAAEWDRACGDPGGVWGPHARRPPRGGERTRAALPSHHAAALYIFWTGIRRLAVISGCSHKSNELTNTALSVPVMNTQ